jgi:hypothetical protein
MSCSLCLILSLKIPVYALLYQKSLPNPVAAVFNPAAAAFKSCRRRFTGLQRSIIPVVRLFMGQGDLLIGGTIRRERSGRKAGNVQNILHSEQVFPASGLVAG